MSKIKLTKVQTQFLESIYEFGAVDEYWECYKHEKRTAKALQRKGLLEFQENEEPSNDCDYFMARMTKKARDIFFPDYKSGAF